MQETENGGPPRNGNAGYAAAPYTGTPQDGLSDCILLAACGANELLPQSPHVPADVFTACLTTPIKACSIYDEAYMRCCVSLHTGLPQHALVHWHVAGMADACMPCQEHVVMHGQDNLMQAGLGRQHAVAV